MNETMSTHFLEFQVGCLQVSRSMRTINLFSYSNTFRGAKRKILRPGIGFKSAILVLTHTRPSKAFVEIDGSSIVSDHFGARSEVVYLTTPDLVPVRYNNAVGGELHLDALLIEKISRTFNIDLDEIWAASINNNNFSHQIINSDMKYSDLSQFLPATQAEILPKGATLFQSQDPQTGTKSPASVETIFNKVQDNITKGADNTKFAGFLPAFTLAEAKATLALIPGLHTETGLAALTLENAAEMLPILNDIVNKNPNTNDDAGEAILLAAEKLNIELNLEAYNEVDPADAVAAINAELEEATIEAAAENEAHAADPETDAANIDAEEPVNEEPAVAPTNPDNLPAQAPPVTGMVLSTKAQKAIVDTLAGLSEANQGIAKATEALTSLFTPEAAAEEVTEDAETEVVA